MSLSPGTRIGAYEVVAPLGAGGMGEVYRARDPRIERDVAIKLLPEDLASPEWLARFELEARAAGGLNHPNLVTIHELGTQEGNAYIVMELLEGETLRERLAVAGGSSIGSGGFGAEATGRPLAARKAVEIAIQLANGLAAAHSRNIAHRDLKPENIFLTADGRVKILDFGIAKKFAPDPAGFTGGMTAKQKTSPGSVIGTANYMSPEQVRGQFVDHRADVFSFGSVLFEMLTGVKAFRGDSAIEVLNAILSAEPPALSARGDEAGTMAALDDIVRHCLEKNPAERFQSMHDVAFALQHLRGGGTTETLRARDLLPRRNGVLTGASLVIVLAAGIGVGSLFRRDRTEPAPTPPIIRPFTFSGNDLSPDVSPDGSLVAFASTRGGGSRIWVRQVAGGSDLSLTRGAGDRSPRWSPDGTSVLFVRSAEKSSAVFRVPALGGEARKLVDDATDADWSPDGRTIAFVRLESRGSVNDSIVMIANADGTEPKEVARVAGVPVAAPRWSPDGTRIALIDASPGYRVRYPYIVGLDGTVTRMERIVVDGAMHSNVVWVDRDRVVMSESLSATYSPPGLGSRVFIADLRDQSRQVLFYTSDRNYTIDPTPDGRLVLDTVTSKQNLREYALGAVVENAGHWLTRGASLDRQPNYTADGTAIVFSSTSSGNLDVWRVSVADGALTRLTDDPGDDFDPSLTRDGRNLLWSSRRSGNYEVWIASVDGNDPRKLTSDGVDAENPTATPDGEWIAYNSYNPAKRGIWKIKRDGSGAMRVVEGETRLPEISPDGKYVAYSTIGVGARQKVARLEDGAQFDLSPLTNIPRQSQFGSFTSGRSRWMPDGAALAFVDCDMSGRCGVFAQDFEPGRDTLASRRRLTGFEDFALVESFSFSPDGKRITVSAVENSQTIMITDPIPLLGTE